jgi:predicted nuclease of predicted toxin-antitoxin system
MKVLLDENVSGGLAHALKKLGHAVLAVGPDLPSGSPDEAVFAFLLKQQAVLVTRDYHFTNPVRFDSEKTHGIIYIHNGNLTSDQEIRLVTDFLQKHTPEEYRGKLVTLYLNSVTIR